MVMLTIIYDVADIPVKKMANLFSCRTVSLCAFVVATR